VSPNVNLAIVVAQFNSEITQKMLEQALKRSKELGATVTYICKVPGSFDMPIIIQDLLEKEDVDAIATLGAILQGETAHDQIIAATLSNQISALSTKLRKPVTLGVSGPRENIHQAQSRAEKYATRSVEAAVKLVKLRKEISKQNKHTRPVIAE